MARSGYWSVLNKLAVLAVCAFLVLNLLSWRVERHVRQVKAKKSPKKILLWNSMFERQDYYFGIGDMPFFERGCEFTNCTIATWAEAVDDFEIYDAVIFHGPEFDPATFNMSSRRTPKQVFVYLSMESPLNRPAVKGMDDFFNMTITHRLDSDVQLPYFYFKDEQGNLVSPSANPAWRKPDKEASEKYANIHKRKSRVAAWFSSNCGSHSQREAKVRELQRFAEVDVYGSCGPLVCPRSESRCFNMLRDDYYFYLSFENSLCADYITEKAANPYRYESIPVIFSGANLTRYLPPDSYLDASQLSPDQLADKMNFLVKNPDEYAKYFWWKAYYTITLGELDSGPAFCKLCQILHRNYYKRYVNFAPWWEGNHRKHVCF